MSFWGELKRRNVFKVGAAYLVAAWLILQVASITFPALSLPAWALTLVTVFLIIGFFIAIILAWAYEVTPDGVKQTKKVPLADSITHVTGQKLNYVMAGLLIIAVGYIVIDKAFLGRSPVETEVDSTVAEQAPASAEAEIEEIAKTIAVLPFADLSPEKDQEYFADGIAEELLNSLSRVSELEVRGRTSSFYFKGKDEDLHTISKMLNVDHILEGSVRKAGEQVRITVQLINTRKDAHVWSKTYERTMEDIFAIQDDIAKSVADALQITLGVGELGRTPGMTRNIAAYDAFLAGRSLILRLGRENISQTIEQLEQAVALDPDFAIGWYYLSDAYHLAAIAWIPERAEEYFAKRNAARLRVIELNPNTDFALEFAALRSNDWVEVEQLYQKALAVAPTNYDMYDNYGWFLNRMGKPGEAIDYFKRFVRMEPLSSNAHLGLGHSYELSGNIDAATVAIKKARELSNQPAVYDTSLLVLTLEENNRALIDEYVALVQNGEALGNVSDTSYVMQVLHALLDTPEEVGTELRLLLTNPASNNPFARDVIALWASYFGKHEIALQVYRESVESEWNIWTIWRPIHKGMRQLPGFKDIVREIGLVDYWRTTGKWGKFCHPVGEDDFECD